MGKSTGGPDGSSNSLNSPVGSVSYAAVVAVNIVPLVLVLGGWSSAPLLLLIYWGELVVVGFFATLRAATAVNVDPHAPGSSAFEVGGAYLVCCIVLLVCYVSLMEPAPGTAQSAALFPLPFWFAIAVIASSYTVEFVRRFLPQGRHNPMPGEGRILSMLLGMVVVLIMAGAILSYVKEHGASTELAVVLVALKIAAELTLRLRRRA